MEEKIQETKLDPYRLAALMKAASKITDLMVNSVWHLSFDEMELVLGLVRHGIERSKEVQNVSE